MKASIVDIPYSCIWMLKLNEISYFIVDTAWLEWWGVRKNSQELSQGPARKWQGYNTWINHARWRRWSDKQWCQVCASCRRSHDGSNPWEGEDPERVRSFGNGSWFLYFQEAFQCLQHLGHGVPQIACMVRWRYNYIFFTTNCNVCDILGSLSAIKYVCTFLLLWKFGRFICKLAKYLTFLIILIRAINHLLSSIWRNFRHDNATYNIHSYNVISESNVKHPSLQENKAWR